MSRRIVVGVTGASGAVYAVKLLDGLLRSGEEIHLIVSAHAQALIATELGSGDLASLVSTGLDRLTTHRHDDLFSRLASGSFQTDGMAICPCSSNTLGAIASGRSDSLITRAAQVHLKERRRLILCVREMPLTQIDLENMLRVGQAGGVVCPASPAFYAQPKGIDDLVNTVVVKLMDLLGVASDLPVRWAGRQDQTMPTSDFCG